MRINKLGHAIGSGVPPERRLGAVAEPKPRKAPVKKVAPAVPPEDKPAESTKFKSALDTPKKGDV